MKQLHYRRFVSYSIGIGLLILGTFFLKNATSGELVNLNITGGISANDNPATFNNGVLINGSSVEIRNANYDIFYTTASGGTKYFEATPSSVTIRQPLIATGNVSWSSAVSTFTSAGALTISGLLTVPNITLGSQGVMTGSAFAVIPSSAVTNTTSETTLFSTTINANTLGANGCIHVMGMADTAAANANTKTLKINFGGTTFGNEALTANWWSWKVNHLICNKGATNSQVAWPAGLEDGMTGNAGNTTGTIDTTANQTFTITATLGVATDTVTWNAGFLQVIK